MFGGHDGADKTRNPRLAVRIWTQNHGCHPALPIRSEPSSPGLSGDREGVDMDGSDVLRSGRTRFGVDWLLTRSDARDVSRAVRKLRQTPAGEQSDRFPEGGP